MNKKKRERKYRIYEMYRWFGDGFQDLIVQHLCNDMKVSFSTLRKIWYFQPDDINEMKPSQLQAAANFFGLETMERMLSNSPPITPEEKKHVLLSVIQKLLNAQKQAA